jgi:hypothetical protein
MIKTHARPRVSRAVDFTGPVTFTLNFLSDLMGNPQEESLSQEQIEACKAPEVFETKIITPNGRMGSEPLLLLR